MWEVNLHHVRCSITSHVYLFVVSYFFSLICWWYTWWRIRISLRGSSSPRAGMPEWTVQMRSWRRLDMRSQKKWQIHSHQTSPCSRTSVRILVTSRYKIWIRYRRKIESLLKNSYEPVFSTRAANQIRYIVWL